MALYHVVLLLVSQAAVKQCILDVLDLAHSDLGVLLTHQLFSLLQQGVFELLLVDFDL